MRYARSGKTPEYPLALRMALALIPFVILLVLATLSGSISSAAQPLASELAASPTSIDVCTEPNDVAQQAQGPLLCDTTYYCLLEKNWDLDFFYIDLTGPVVITIDLTDIPPASDWDLYLYDSEVKELAYSVEAGNSPELIAHDISEPGRYYIAVECYDGPRNDYPYTLSISCTVPSGDTPTPSATFTFGPTSTPTSSATTTGQLSPTATSTTSVCTQSWRRTTWEPRATPATTSP